MKFSGRWVGDPVRPVYGRRVPCAFLQHIPPVLLRPRGICRQRWLFRRCRFRDQTATGRCFSFDFYLEGHHFRGSASYRTGRTSISICHFAEPQADGRHYNGKTLRGVSWHRPCQTSGQRYPCRRSLLLDEVHRPVGRTLVADLWYPRPLWRKPPSKLVPLPSRSGFAEPA